MNLRRADLRRDECGACLLVLRTHEEGETRGEEEEAHEREGLKDVNNGDSSPHDRHSRLGEEIDGQKCRS
jgi:hypothetical protein